jgi:hypothetical protein
VTPLNNCGNYERKPWVVQSLGGRFRPPGIIRRRKRRDVGVPNLGGSCVGLDLPAVL